MKKRSHHILNFSIFRPVLTAAAAGLVIAGIAVMSGDPSAPMVAVEDAVADNDATTNGQRQPLRTQAVRPRRDLLPRQGEGGNPRGGLNVVSAPTRDSLQALDDAVADGDELTVVRSVLESALVSDRAAGIEHVFALLMDSGTPLSYRVETALALGAHGGPEGAEKLLQAFYETDEELLIGPILDGLAQTPFDAEDSLLAKLIRDPYADLETRVEALEALGEFTPLAGDFLLDVAADDPSPEIRRAAAEAAMLVSEDDGAAQALARLTLREEDAGVRAAFYAAIAGDNYDLSGLREADDLLRLIAAESLPRARLEGTAMLAAAIDAGNDGLVAEFDAVHVPWLLEMTASDLGRGDLRLAVAALMQSGSDGAKAALNELSKSRRFEVADAAGEALAKVLQQ